MKSRSIKFNLMSAAVLSASLLLTGCGSDEKTDATATTSDQATSTKTVAVNLDTETATYKTFALEQMDSCLLYTSPSPRD